MSKILSLTLAALSFVFVSHAHADPTSTCGEDTLNGFDVKWCHEYDTSSTSNDVVVYFHGLMGTEKNWSHSALHDFTVNEAQTKHHAYPHVFSFTLGMAWLVGDVPGPAGVSKFDMITKTLIPKFLAMVGHLATRFTLVGQSMGGFNVLRLAFAQPQLAANVVSLCPALTTLGPFATQAEIQAYETRNAPYVDNSLVNAMIQVGRSEFPTEADWERNDIFKLASAPTAALPPLFMADDSHDQFGFYEGDTAFFKLWNTNGHTVEMQEQLGGGHCEFSDAILQTAADHILGL